MMMWG